MAPRRRSQYLSSRQAKDEPLARFVKIVLEFNIDHSMLRLPLRFVDKFRNKLSGVAKLYVSDGRVWKVGLRRDGQNIWLQNGFQEFVTHYSLCFGNVLHFEYKGMTNFAVYVFDLSNCESSYPPHEVIEIPDSSPHPTPSTSKGKKKKDIPSKLSKYRNESGNIVSPRQFKSKKPHFEVILKKINFTHSVAYVPSKFGRKYFPGPIGRRESVELGLVDGRKWNVALKGRKSGRVNFGGGWKAFQEENRLKVNDVCVFELLKKNEFKVHLFIAL
ncbi:B3 domain-containing transcription factor VRN1 [Euphorbia peplus]|nr:B3 domain-containing transcription factor VRN1 [Euphorbia peplus]